MSTSSEKAKSTIVIKRIKKGGHGAHGAAWKIAYADFVTAMMAFFLLMWLLGSTTKGDLKGISEYFQSPLQVSLSGGDGAGDSDTVVTGGGDDLTKAAGQIKRGEIQAKKHRRDEIQRKERVRMEDLKRHLDQAILASDKMVQFKDQIRVEITPDGLRGQSVWAPDTVTWNADAVVLVTQRQPLDSLYHELRADPERLEQEGIESVYRVGDCVAPRTIAENVFDGHRLAREIDTADPAAPLPFIRELPDVRREHQPTT